MLSDDIIKLKECSGGYLDLANLDKMFDLNHARTSRNGVMPLLLDSMHQLIPEVKSTIYATVADAKGSAVAWHQKFLMLLSGGIKRKLEPEWKSILKFWKYM